MMNRNERLVVICVAILITALPVIMGWTFVMKWVLLGFGISFILYDAEFEHAGEMIIAVLLWPVYLGAFLWFLVFPAPFDEESARKDLRDAGIEESRINAIVEKLKAGEDFEFTPEESMKIMQKRMESLGYQAQFYEPTEDHTDSPEDSSENPTDNP